MKHLQLKQQLILSLLLLLIAALAWQVWVTFAAHRGPYWRAQPEVRFMLFQAKSGDPQPKHKTIHKTAAPKANLQRLSLLQKVAEYRKQKKQRAQAAKISQTQSKRGQQPGSQKLASQRSASKTEPSKKTASSKEATKGKQASEKHSTDFAHFFKTNTKKPADTLNYTLLYTGQQAGHWYAAIKRKGRIYDVALGHRLPKGVRVASIANGVVILSHGKVKKVITTYHASEFNSSTQKAIDYARLNASKATKPARSVGGHERKSALLRSTQTVKHISDDKKATTKQKFAAKSSKRA